MILIHAVARSLMKLSVYSMELRSFVTRHRGPVWEKYSVDWVARSTFARTSSGTCAWAIRSATHAW